MANESGPFLVREDPPPVHEERVAEPGVHSHNRARRTPPPPPPSEAGWLRRFRITLFLLGVAATGYYAYTLADEYVYQAYENWAFDQQIAGRSSVSFGEYLREQTAFGFLADAPDTPRKQGRVHQPQPAPAALPLLPQGSVLGRLSIERLNISAIVREGVDAATLSRAVGHVPSTSLAGQLGNCSIAAHRDTLFRALRNIRIGDLVQFQAPAATYTYRVIATQIVRPSDVSVLRADGGPRLLEQISERPSRLLTMITCYPFNYVGSAPERFIVQAEAVDYPPPPVPAAQAVTRLAKPLPAVRHPSRFKLRASRPLSNAPSSSAQPPQARSNKKKKGFWQRLLSSV